MDIFSFLITIFECVIAVIFIIIIFMVFVFYFAQFAEEKMNKMKKYLLYLTYFICGLSFMLMFSGFEWYAFIPALVTNLLWLYIQYDGFPLISLNSPVLVIAFVMTIVSHFFFMIHFLGDEDTSFWRIMCYFILIVWLLPILVLSSLCAVDEDQVGQPEEKKSPSQPSNQPASKSVFSKMISRLLKKAETSLPHSGNKDD